MNYYNHHYFKLKNEYHLKENRLSINIEKIYKASINVKKK